jgi:hypothetical protein
MNENNASFEGTVTISKKNDNYYFVFNLTAEKNGVAYTIEGEYNDALTAY